MAERVFQYTDNHILAQFGQGDAIDFDRVRGLPTLLLEEGRGDEIVKVCHLNRVARHGREYVLEYSVDTTIPRITNADIAALERELNLHEWELGTNHWAIKDVDLFEVLYRHGIGEVPSPTVFQLSRSPVNPRLVSFMMPFDGSFAPVYGTASQTLGNAGFVSNRADDMWVHQHIMADIIELICTSAVIVCDLSSKNPNVFYEAGIAHTLGKDVVLITQSHDDVPFDLKPIRYLHYLNNDQGRQQLADQLLLRVRQITGL